VYDIDVIQNLELCSTCYEKYGHEHAVKRCSAESESRAPTKSGDATSGVIQRCIETVAHAAACTLGAACPRQPECGKMMDVLRHARACTLRTSCTVCQQLMALCVTHARACTVDSLACHVPFCAELRRHMERRQAVQRHQQHQMDDRRRALMTGLAPVSDEFTLTNGTTEVTNGTERCIGKGGDGPQETVVGDLSTTVSRAENMTADYKHPTNSGDILHHNGCGVVGNPSSTTTELKTASRSVSLVGGDLTRNRAMNRSDSSAPSTTAVSNVSERIHAAGDGPALEVLHTTESLARHQMVVGCLRVLKRVSPSMSKQNLLQLLCHCSRQQLTALHDKVNSFDFDFNC